MWARNRPSACELFLGAAWRRVDLKAAEVGSADCAEEYRVKNEYIGLRLGIAFSLLIAILVGVGWFLGLSRMGRINADLEEIVNKRWAKVQLAREAMNYWSLNNRITMEI